MRRAPRTFVTPTELKDQLETEAAGIPPGEFITNPKYQHLKDVWCAAHFGIGYKRHVSPCTLWVNPEQNSDVDFAIKTKRGEFEFQTIIADVPGRRMSDEHRPLANGASRITPYEPGRGSMEGPKWIASAVQKKIGKKYSAQTTLNLLVYANFSADELRYNAVRDEVKQVTSRFASTWVVTNHLIFTVCSTEALGTLENMRLIYDFEALR
jgi:hypothetical protein